MSAVQINQSSQSSTPRGGEYMAVTPARSDEGVTAAPQSAEDALSSRVHDELGRLVEFMPARDREVFCFRWGLRGEFPHIPRQAERKFELPRTTVEAMLSRCLWNIARHAQLHELPALREALGADRERWAERAWALALRRWGDLDPAFSEAVLLLAVAGVGVQEAHQVARQHLVDVGLGRGNRWGKPLSECEQLEASRQIVDRMLEEVLWPASGATLADLGSFTVHRPLAAWAPPKTGVFASAKLGRLVQFDSDLELVILRALESDCRVVEYVEQPLTIPYALDGEAHEYTPDVIVRLQDGRVFVIEAKPREGLGDFANWMKWASLARWCGQAGIGLWIGSPQRSIGEHRRMQPDAERHEFVLEELRAGELSGEDYSALLGLIGKEQLGLIATAELLDWRAKPWRLQPTDGADREEARRFWALIDRHHPPQTVEPTRGGTA